MKKIFYLSSSLLVFLLLLFFLTNIFSSKEINKEKQIKSFLYDETSNTLKVSTDLPKYRSKSDFFIASSKDDNSLDLSLVSKFDFSLNNETDFLINSKLLENSNIKYINLFANNKLISTYQIR